MIDRVAAQALGGDVEGRAAGVAHLVAAELFQRDVRLGTQLRQAEIHDL